jgi:hypothetical protein
MTASFRHLEIARTLVRHLAVNVLEHLQSAVEALSLIITQMTDEVRQTANHAEQST